MTERRLPLALAALALLGCRSDDARARSELEHLEARGALGPYSAAVLTDALCFVSGQVAPRERRGGSFEAEVEAAIDAVAAELARAGLSLSDVVAVDVYLTDIGSFAALNEVYARRFPAPHPARTTVAVVALPGSARVELRAIARRR